MLVLILKLFLHFNLYEVSLLFITYTYWYKFLTNFICIYSMLLFFPCIIIEMTVSIYCKRLMESKWMNEKDCCDIYFYDTIVHLLVIIKKLKIYNSSLFLILGHWNEGYCSLRIPHIIYEQSRRPQKRRDQFLPSMK